MRHRNVADELDEQYRRKLVESFAGTPAMLTLRDAAPAAGRSVKTLRRNLSAIKHSRVERCDFAREVTRLPLPHSGPAC